MQNLIKGAQIFGAKKAALSHFPIKSIIFYDPLKIAINVENLKFEILHY